MSETSFQQLAENSADVIMRIGRDARAYYVSPSSLRLLGWAPEEIIGKGADDFVFLEDLPAVIEAGRRTLAGESNVSPTTYRMRCKDGSLVWVESKSRLMLDPATGKPGDFVLTMRDITDRKRLEEQLSVLASTDGLTGLLNRRAFDHTLETEWKRALRDGSPISLLLLDLDHFKGFNDHYGHQVGDDCLRSVAVAVRGTIRRPGDTAARYGGEEIAVILPNTDAAGAAKVAEQVRSGIEALALPHLANAEGGGSMTTSIGAATAVCCRTGSSMKMPQALLAAADTALYKAKNNGRNRVTTLSITHIGLTRVQGWHRA